MSSVNDIRRVNKEPRQFGRQFVLTYSSIKSFGEVSSVEKNTEERSSLDHDLSNLPPNLDKSSSYHITCLLVIALQPLLGKNEHRRTVNPLKFHSPLQRYKLQK